MPSVDLTGLSSESVRELIQILQTASQNASGTAQSELQAAVGEAQAALQAAINNPGFTVPAAAGGTGYAISWGSGSAFGAAMQAALSSLGAAGLAALVALGDLAFFTTLASLLSLSLAQLFDLLDKLERQYFEQGVPVIITDPGPVDVGPNGLGEDKRHGK